VQAPRPGDRSESKTDKSGPSLCCSILKALGGRVLRGLRRLRARQAGVAAVHRGVRLPCAGATSGSSDGHRVCHPELLGLRAGRGAGRSCGRRRRIRRPWRST
jgi:hypothetical protein